MRLFGKVYQNFRLQSSLLFNTKHRYSALRFGISRPALSRRYFVKPTQALWASRPFGKRSVDPRCTARHFSKKSGDSNISDHNKGNDADQTAKSVVHKGSSPKQIKSNAVPVALINIKERKKPAVKIALVSPNPSESDEAPAKHTLRTLSAVRKNLGLLELLADAMSGTGHGNPKQEAPSKYEAAESYLLENYDNDNELGFWRSYSANMEGTSESIKLYDNLDQAMQGGATYVQELTKLSGLNVIPFHDSKNYTFANVPEKLEQNLEQTAIASMDLSLEMNMTDIKEALLNSNEGDDTTHIKAKSTDQAADEKLVSLDINALIQGSIEVDSSKYSTHNLGSVSVSEFNDAMTAIAANLCSSALQQGVAIDMGRSYSTESSSSGSKKSNQPTKKSKPRVVFVRKRNKVPVWPGAAGNWESTLGDVKSAAAPPHTETAVEKQENTESESVLLSSAKLGEKAESNMSETNEAHMIPGNADSLQSTLSDLKAPATPSKSEMAAEKEENTEAESKVILSAELSAEPEANMSESIEPYIVPGNVDNLKPTLSDLKAPATPSKSETHQNTESESTVLLSGELSETNEDYIVPGNVDKLKSTLEDLKATASPRQTETAAEEYEYTTAISKVLLSGELSVEPKPNTSDTNESYLVPGNVDNLESTLEDLKTEEAPLNWEMLTEKEEDMEVESMVLSSPDTLEADMSGTNEAFITPGNAESILEELNTSVIQPELQLAPGEEENTEAESMVLASAELSVAPEADISETNEISIIPVNADNLESTLEDIYTPEKEASNEEESMALTSAEHSAEPLANLIEIHEEITEVESMALSNWELSAEKEENTETESMVLSSAALSDEPETNMSEIHEANNVPVNVDDPESTLEDLEAAAAPSYLEMTAEKYEYTATEYMVMSSAELSVADDTHNVSWNVDNLETLEDLTAEKKENVEAESTVLSPAEHSAEPQTNMSETHDVHFVPMNVDDLENTLEELKISEVQSELQLVAEEEENAESESMVLSSAELSSAPEADISETHEAFIIPVNVDNLESTIDDLYTAEKEPNNDADSMALTSAEHIAEPEVNLSEIYEENTEVESMVLSSAALSDEPETNISETHHVGSLESTLEDIQAAEVATLKEENKVAESMVLSSAELSGAPKTDMSETNDGNAENLESTLEDLQTAEKVSHNEPESMALTSAEHSAEPEANLAEIHEESTEIESMVLSSAELSAETETIMSETNEAFIIPVNAENLESTLEDLQMGEKEANNEEESMTLTSAEPETYTGETQHANIGSAHVDNLESTLEDLYASEVYSKSEMAAEEEEITEAESAVLSSAELIAEPGINMAEEHHSYIDPKNVDNLESTLEDLGAAEVFSESKLFVEKEESTEADSMVLSSAELSAETEINMSEDYHAPYIGPETGDNLESTLKKENTKTEAMVLSSAELSAETETNMSEDHHAPYIGPAAVDDLESTLEDLGAAEVFAESKLVAETEGSTEYESMVLSSAELGAEPESEDYHSPYIGPTTVDNQESTLEDLSADKVFSKSKMAALKEENTKAKPMVLTSAELSTEAETNLSEAHHAPYIGPAILDSLESTPKDLNSSEVPSQSEINTEKYEYVAPEYVILSASELRAEPETNMSETNEAYNVAGDVDSLDFTLDYLTAVAAPSEVAAEEGESTEVESTFLSLAEQSPEPEANMSETKEAYILHGSADSLELVLEKLKAAVAPFKSEIANAKDKNAEAGSKFLSSAEFSAEPDENMRETKEAYSVLGNVDDMKSTLEYLTAVAATSTKQMHAEKEDNTEPESMVLLSAELSAALSAEPEISMSETNEAYSVHENVDSLESTLEDLKADAVPSKSEIDVEKDENTQAGTKFLPLAEQGAEHEANMRDTNEAYSVLGSVDDMKSTLEYLTALAASSKMEMAAEKHEAEDYMSATNDAFIVPESINNLESMLEDLWAAAVAAAEAKTKMALQNIENTDTDSKLLSTIEVIANPEANMSVSSEDYILPENVGDVESNFKALMTAAAPAKAEMAAEKYENTEADSMVLSSDQLSAETEPKISAAVSPAKKEKAAKKEENTEAESMTFSSTELSAEPEPKMSISSEDYILPENIGNLESKFEDFKTAAAPAEMEMAVEKGENTEAESTVFSLAELSSEPQAKMSASSEDYILPEDLGNIESSFEDFKAAAAPANTEMAVEEYENAEADSMVHLSAELSAEQDAKMSEDYILFEDAGNLEPSFEDFKIAAAPADAEMAVEDYENAEADSMVLLSAELSAEPEAKMSASSEDYILPENVGVLDSTFKDLMTAAAKMEIEVEEDENTEAESKFRSSAELSAEPDENMSQTNEAYNVLGTADDMKSTLDYLTAVAASSSKEKAVEKHEYTEAESMVLSSVALSAESEVNMSASSEDYILPEDVGVLDSTFKDLLTAAGPDKMKMAVEEYENTGAEFKFLSSAELSAEPDEYMSEANDVSNVLGNPDNMKSTLGYLTTLAASSSKEIAIEKHEYTDAESVLFSAGLSAEPEAKMSASSEDYILPEDVGVVDSTFKDFMTTAAQMESKKHETTEPEYVVLYPAEFSGDPAANMSLTNEALNDVPGNENNLVAKPEDLTAAEASASTDKYVILYPAELSNEPAANMSAAYEAKFVPGSESVEPKLDDLTAVSDISSSERLESTEAEYVVLYAADLSGEPAAYMSETNKAYIVPGKGDNLESTQEDGTGATASFSMEMTDEEYEQAEDELMALSATFLSFEPEVNMSETHYDNIIPGNVDSLESSLDDLRIIEPTAKAEAAGLSYYPVLTKEASAEEETDPVEETELDAEPEAVEDEGNMVYIFHPSVQKEAAAKKAAAGAESIRLARTQLTPTVEAVSHEGIHVFYPKKDSLRAALEDSKDAAAGEDPDEEDVPEQEIWPKTELIARELMSKKVYSNALREAERRRGLLKKVFISDRIRKFCTFRTSEPSRPMQPPPSKIEMESKEPKLKMLKAGFEPKKERAATEAAVKLANIKTEGGNFVSDLERKNFKSKIESSKLPKFLQQPPISPEPYRAKNKDSESCDKDKPKSKPTPCQKIKNPCPKSQKKAPSPTACKYDKKESPCKKKNPCKEDPCAPDPCKAAQNTPAAEQVPAKDISATPARNESRKNMDKKVKK